MSATAAPVPPTRSKLDAVAFVAGLSDLDKHAVLLALLREAIDINGDTGPIPVDDGTGKMFGYYVPPKAAEAMRPAGDWPLTDAEESALKARLSSSEGEPCVPIGEVIADLKRRLADLQQQP